MGRRSRYAAVTTAALLTGMLTAPAEATVGPETSAVPASAALSGTTSTATAINASGQVAGSADTAGEQGHALLSRSVCIDPGHGGRDPGTHYRSLTEANVNLDVAKRLGHLLTAGGYRPYYTRTMDTYLTTRARANICNSYRTSILVSIHQNAASDTSADYSVALFFKSSDRRLARVVVSSTSVLTGHNYGVVHFASPILMNSKMPATISEALFMTATREGTALTKRSGARQQQEAQAIYNGIVNYFAGRQ